MQPATSWQIWKRWTIYCSAGELLGIGGAAMLAWLFNSWWGEPTTFSGRLVNWVVMLGAGLVEGSILGWMQWRVLKTLFPKIPDGRWIRYTIYVAMLGWGLGMLPSLFITSSEAAAESSFVPPGPTTLLFYVLVLGMGLFLGAIFGWFQWLALRRYVKSAYDWIYGNMIGWAFGMLWIFLFASWPTETSPWWMIALSGLLGGLSAGLSVGGITGLFLLRILKREGQLFFVKRS